jgi:hypothetical protein
VTDPVKTIQTARRRLARLAALQTTTALLPPIVVLVAVALSLRTLGAHSWERLGFLLSAQSTQYLQTGLLAGAALGIAVAAVLALMSFRRSDDPIAAAELIDRRLQCRQEVLTLATMADAGSGSSRSPLFPVLWRRAAEYLDKLDLARVLPFQAGAALRQALFLSVCTVALLVTGITVLLAANHPPLGADARQIRRLAREIANSGTDAHTRDLADKLRAVAEMLENPKVPPQTKLEQLASAQRELKAQQQRQQKQEHGSNPAQAGSSQGQAGGKGNQGKGTSEGQEGAAQGQGKGSGPGAGSGTGKGAKGENQLAEASKDISKVQAQLEAQAAKQRSAMLRSDSGGRKGRSPRPGEQPDLARLESAKNGSNLNPNQIKTGPARGEEPGRNRSAQSGQPRKDFGSSQGDTHLGQFPEPGNFERFYRAGEHGPPLDVKNARYVLFRIPPAIQRGGGGKSVLDNERPSATVPYENVPLKEERIAADPDERQLVPPRYRDLLR